MNTMQFPMRSRFQQLAAMLVLTTGASSLALAQAPVRDTIPSTDVRTGSVELKRADRNFFEKAAKASMTEVEISQVAVARTSNPEVKRFAQMMIDDHGSASEELARLAANKGVSLPAKDTHPNRWEKHSANTFDRDYIDKMVSDHEDAVKLFAKQATDGNDPEAVAFARKHLTKLQHHLQKATDLQRMLK